MDKAVFSMQFGGMAVCQCSLGMSTHRRQARRGLNPTRMDYPGIRYAPGLRRENFHRQVDGNANESQRETPNIGALENRNIKIIVEVI